jgi:hypothetical protein
MNASESRRALVPPVVAGATVSFLFVLLMVGGFHAPRPHALPLAVAAPPRQVQELRAHLAARAPGAFALHGYPTAAAARVAVRSGDVVGGAVVGPGGVTVLTAAAQGAAAGEAVRGAFAGLGAAAHLPVRTVEVVPLPAGDSGGLAGFMTVLGTTIASAAFAALLLFGGGRPGARGVVAALASFAVLAGVTGAAAGAVFGAFAGHVWAVAGVAALLALAVASTIVALGNLLGRAGFALGVLLVVLLGISSSGTAVGYRFEPAFHRAISPWFPSGAAVEAIRDVAYYGGAHSAARLAVLAAWAGASLALLALAALARAPRERAAVVSA